MLTCTRCGRHMEHIESTIGNSPYCHPDAGPDCYRITSLEYALPVSSMPQRIMAGMPPVIPLHETPIYAQLKAEYAEPKYGTVWVKVLPDMSKFREQRKPLLKKGRKK